MSLLDKMAKRTIDRHVEGNHPIIKMGVDRDVLDAYFRGLVFAALADDGQVDEKERERIAKAGLSLELSENEQNEAINGISGQDDDGKLKLMEEVAAALKGTPAPFLFLCEFSLIWLSHDGNREELSGYRLHLSDWMGIAPYDNAFFDRFDAVAIEVREDKKKVFELTDRIAEETLAYLFADIEEIFRMFSEERAKADRQITPHPLKRSFSDDKKILFLECGLIAYADSDRTFDVEEHHRLRQFAVSLGVADETLSEMEKRLSVPTAEYKSKMLAALNESLNRDEKFFLYCNIARLFAMDGYPIFSAAQTRFLEDLASSMKLVPEDVAFLKEYSAFLGNGKEPNAAEVVQRAQSSICFPDGFIRYFTPNMKPIVLAGGDTAPGVYQIVDGHYRLEKPLKVGQQTRLVIKNAVIDFAPEAEIELNNCTTEISDSTFNGERGDHDAPQGRPIFSGYSTDIKFEGCCFNGAECRSAICFGGSINIISSRFNRLNGGNDFPILGPKGDGYISSRLECCSSQFNDCHASTFLLRAYHIKFMGCDFKNSSAYYLVHCHGYNATTAIVACLFGECLFEGDCQCDDSDGVFSDYDGIRHSEFKSNFCNGGEGLNRICNVTLEEFQKARILVRKELDNLTK